MLTELTGTKHRNHCPALGCASSRQFRTGDEEGMSGTTGQRAAGGGRGTGEQGYAGFRTHLLVLPCPFLVWVLYVLLAMDCKIAT